MKYLIASDIHGSEYYCKMLIEAFEREGADRMLLLGDLLYHGPRNELPRGYNPKGVIALLNSVSDKIFCVRGNCEAEVDQMVLDFPVMADYCLICGGENNDRLIFATHGHIYNENSLPPHKKGDILLNGHTHIPVFREYDDYTYINPGSVSIPKEDSKHSYMTFDGRRFIWKDLCGEEYDEYRI